jgi:hypothetical protein
LAAAGFRHFQLDNAGTFLKESHNILTEKATDIAFNKEAFPDKNKLQKAIIFSDSF